MEQFDVLIIGAGPTGLACAIEARRAGYTAVAVDKGCLCNSLYNYPTNMTFFTTPELLEIGDIPFASAQQKPSRLEALEYYRKVAEFYRLQVRQFHTVVRIEGSDGAFLVHCTDMLSRPTEFLARKLVVATGYYDLPNRMAVSGEDLPKVTHYYREPHPFYDSDVVVVGAKNSAAIAALELWRHGARVTMVHRGAAISPNVKYWIKPDIENRIKNHEIAAYFNTSVREITPDSILLETPNGEVRLKNDFVLAMTGYHPDFSFLRALGVQLSDQPSSKPVVDPHTLESNVRGIYLAGVIIAGMNTNEIFIENGRFHGRQIAEDLRRKLGEPTSEPLVPENSRRPTVVTPPTHLRNAE
ncbi:MAG TPA: YpdA family putative bacillithiol disulfide reductase [Candidatus Saccharimonadales bacterium]|nr:YpdA family putative bacillithiol disulfide reductase [Candidatus Saccharimonadales bacterium]